MKKKTKLQIKKEAARAGIIDVSSAQGRGFSDDLIKHYIRYHYWEKRIRDLMRTRKINSVKYFSLCGEEAIDIRLFRRKKLIGGSAGSGSADPPFVFCEEKDTSFEILSKTLEEGRGVKGAIEKIATNSKEQEFGKFWSYFPFDVINLDFWGDIHKTDVDCKDIFYAIRSIIFQQALLKEHYELWITERAIDERAAYVIKDEYRSLVTHNLNEIERFKTKFGQEFKNRSVSALSFDDLARIGFLKWLIYQVKCAFSIVESIQVIVYKRVDKDKKIYKLYNFFIRIKPYEQVPLPSPASQAAIRCEEEYKKKINLCFTRPIDINKTFKKMKSSEKAKLKEELSSLVKEYKRDRRNKMV